MRFIGIVGRKNSGKSDVVQMLLEYFINVKTLSFSEPIKQSTKIQYLLSDQQIGPGKDIEDPRWGHTPRTMMRSIGSMMTFLNDDHYVELMKMRLGQVDPTGLKIVCLSDIRFQNEADYVKEMGGILIHVREPERDVNSPDFEHWDEHISECYSDDIECNYYIENTDPISLRSKTDAIFHEIANLN